VPKPPRARSPWPKRILTWSVTLGLLGWVFASVPLSQAWQALEAAGPGTVLGITAVYFAYTFVADAGATWATFRWFCARLRLRDVIAIRGVTYLLALLNYNVGQGGIVYFVAKKHGVGVTRATGTVLLTMGVMLVALLLLAAVGSATAGAGDPRLAVMQKITTVGLAGFLVYLVLIRLAPPFLTRHEVLAPLFDAGITGHLKAFLVRFPHVAGHVLFQWVLLRMFGVEVPFLAAATLLPVVFVVGWIPIAVQGLGTQQVASIALFARYASGTTADEQAAKVVAFSLTLSAIVSCFSALTGLAFLGTASAREIRPASKPDGA
jgi:hypothetical protein